MKQKSVGLAILVLVVFYFSGCSGILTLPEGFEMIKNSHFTFGDDSWETWQNNGAAANLDFSSRACVLSGSPRGKDYWDVGIGQANLKLSKFSVYEVSFDAVSTIDADFVQVTMFL